MAVQVPDDGDEFFALCVRTPQNDLIGAECRSLAGGSPDSSGFAICERTDRIARAAYIQQGLRTIARAASFEELVAIIAVTDFDADGFRIDIHDPDRRADRPTAEMSMMVANGIPFSPNLKRPRSRFVVAMGTDVVTFGAVVAETDQGYRVHDDKPWTTSSSLDSRFARALVNLVPDARSIVDPCCGAGSIVLEAASLGMEAHGADWKPAMVGMTTKNLEHFGYEPMVVKADSQSVVRHADAVVTDLPYGQALHRDESVIRGILGRSIEAAPRVVCVAHADITTWLTDSGYVDVDVVAVTKRRGFTRWVHSARTSATAT